MAKFRTNHEKKGSNSGVQIMRVGLFAAIFGGLFFAFNYFLGEGLSVPQNTPAGYDGSEAFFVPKSHSGAIIQHNYYTLSYSEAHEQAEWVAYILTNTQLEQPIVDRYDLWVFSKEKFDTRINRWNRR